MSSVALDELTGPPVLGEEPSEPPPPKRLGSPAFVRLMTTILVTFALCGGAAAIGAGIFDGGPKHPTAWDERVAPLVEFVERTRGLRFEHPVAVYFLPVEQYTRAIVGASGGPVADDRDEDEESARDGERFAAFQRALGFVEGPQDLDEANERLQGDGTLAYYDFVRKVVNVRGEEVTVGVRTTLVHELTHALQDQHYDLEARHAEADSEQTAVLRAVLEGDAMAVQQAYIDTLTEAQRRRLEEETDTGVERVTEDLADVPTALQAAQAIPYVLGRPFVALAQTASDGERDPSLLDALMGELPEVTAAVFTPGSDLREAVEVEVPELGDGEPFLTDTVGAFSLFVMLAERIDPIVAMGAVDGWLGDSIVAAEVPADELEGDGPGGEVMCIAARFRMEDAGETAELVKALDEWAAAMPEGARITVSGEGESVALRSCDPGEGAPAGKGGRALDALVYPGARLELASAFVARGLDRGLAGCAADRAVRELTPDELNAGEASPALTAKIEELITRAVQAC